ncbi:DUF3106 domain-containing protein [Pseudoxanthomonas sp. SGNA-20]|uniref:DUF3106 domain-containing protein n=1 Tax=unclassified Pseudoxanthomonas TaxID=2645906 RepID=UPI0002FC0D51|nr:MULTISPECIES: DUF3106 domain-containing protein [unclassified Pseudoxanthomonas]RRN56442.1 DUF3106 domain-containing protein [Pseudoxanthomonas sp. SGNA-20]
MNLRLSLCLAALLLPTVAAARPAQPAPAPAPAARQAELPRWEQLSAEQRELLVAPLRDRWNDNPQERARMLERAQRWKELPPEARERARRGMRRFEQMDPEQRQRARAIFEATRQMTPEQRERFRKEWEQMSPAQRQEWLRAHPARDAH